MDNYLKYVYNFTNPGISDILFYMASQVTKWFKDKRLVQALDNMRQRNLEFMSKCYYCGAEAVAIKSIGEKLYSTCDIHSGPVDN